MWRLLDKIGWDLEIKGLFEGKVDEHLGGVD